MVRRAILTKQLGRPNPFIGSMTVTLHYHITSRAYNSERKMKENHCKKTEKWKPHLSLRPEPFLHFFLFSRYFTLLSSLLYLHFISIYHGHGYLTRHLHWHMSVIIWENEYIYTCLCCYWDFDCYKFSS